VADSLAPEYAERLKSRDAPWKRLLDVQAPYRWNLRRVEPGFVLDIGCGLGRNLGHLGGHGVGVDGNPDCVEAAKTAGFTAFGAEDFHQSPYAQPGRFDSMLVSHVLEHMTFDQAAALLEGYLPYLKPGGQVILITPQEWGYRSDNTHVHFMDTAELRRLAERLALTPARSYSFPFPRWVGPLFRYNEFVLVARAA
jgi:SAM-dependent methyltransferase